MFANVLRGPLVSAIGPDSVYHIPTHTHIYIYIPIGKTLVMKELGTAVAHFALSEFPTAAGGPSDVFSE